MIAKSATKKASTPVDSSGDTCAYATGKTSALKWAWQGVGFDKASTADLLLDGAVYRSTQTSSLGGFNLKFTGLPWRRYVHGQLRGLLRRR